MDYPENRYGNNCQGHESNTTKRIAVVDSSRERYECNITNNYNGSDNGNNNNKCPGLTPRFNAEDTDSESEDDKDLYLLCNR